MGTQAQCTTSRSVDRTILLALKRGWNIFGGNRVGPGASVGGPTESAREGRSTSGHTL